ncbi:MAG: hypothetical protein Q7K71_05645 [Candidatus Omnitrophota bacterium]|nr:hypothetical protein [Candidatus Omnitrophota bacterium]
MTMIEPSGDPIIDILIYKLSVFSPKIDSLIRELDKHMPQDQLEKLMDWFFPPPLDEMEIILTEKLKELEKEAKDRGWDLDLIKKNSKEGKRFSAMTVNERLFAAKLSEVFDLAVNKRDKEQLLEILKKVELSDEQANSTIDAIFSNPKKYGYE